MKKILLLILLLTLAHTHAAEFRVYKATVSLPFVNSITQNDASKFVNTRIANKQLINLTLGQPFKNKPAKELIVAVLVPAATASPTPVSLVVFNTKTGAIVRTIATLTASNALVPDDPKKPLAALASASFTALANTEFDASPFTLTGTLSASAAGTPAATIIKASLGGLHGEFTRNHPTLFFYAGVITSASIRATGKPVVTVNL